MDVCPVSLLGGGADVLGGRGVVVAARRLRVGNCCYRWQLRLASYLALPLRGTGWGLCAPTPALTLLKKSKQKTATRSLWSNPFYMPFFVAAGTMRNAPQILGCILAHWLPNLCPLPAPKNSLGI